MTTKTAKELERDLIEHARDQLRAAARKHVRAGMGPRSAASAAIRETKTLFPPDWKLGVQGDDDDEFVEVWEVEDKDSSPIATVRATAEPPPKLTESQRGLLWSIHTMPKEPSKFSAAQRRTIAKLLKLGLVTVSAGSYVATEAGGTAYWGNERG